MSRIRRPGKQAPEAAPVPERDRRPAPGVITPSQPKVLEAKVRGSQKGFQWVIPGLERAL